MLGACVVKLDTHAQHVAAVGFAYAISLLERAIISWIEWRRTQQESGRV